MKELVEAIAKALVDNPDQVQVRMIEGEQVTVLGGVWTYKSVEQLTTFPNRKFDDLCDAVCQASVWLQSSSYELSYVDFLKRYAAGIAAGLRNKFGEWIVPKPKPGAPGQRLR